MMEPDAVPAGRRRTLLLHPGGAGAPPGVTRDPCQELADGGRVARLSRLQGVASLRGPSLKKPKTPAPTRHRKRGPAPE